MEKKSVLFGYVSKENKEYVEAEKKRTGQTLSFILNNIIDARRTGARTKLQHRVPKYVEKAQNWQKKNLVNTEN
jgi:hypothetical protein